MHPRLTVARAREAERDALRSAVSAVVLGADDLAGAAAGLAIERSAQRDAVRMRLDAATERVAHDLREAIARLDRLEASEKDLLEGASWAEGVASDLPSHLAAVAATRATLEARQVDQRSARGGLDRVLEQRSAASAAMEDADRELAELAGASMDESGLRRELESAGQATRESHEAHAEAVARVQELMAERDKLERRSAELREARATRDPDDLHAVEDFDRVQAALETWHASAQDAGSDAYALALADAFGDLRADLAELESHLAPGPDPDELRRAQEQVDRAGAALERFAAVAPAPPITAAERAELEAAHVAVHQAEERLDRRVGRAGARRHLEAVRAEEATLLARHGFGSYLEVVLSGGRRSASTPERVAAESAFIEAKAVRDGLQRARRSSPELEHLHSEEVRLLSHAVERLGVDPGGAVIELLRVHPDVPAHVVHELRDALAGVGVTPVGVSLAGAATAWLREQAELAELRRASGVAERAIEAELSDIAQRTADLGAELSAARQAEERAATQLEAASRSVGAVEAELTVRAGEDDTRLKRFLAAEQLRTQIEALALTLARAEQDARAMFVQATDAAAAAEVAFDRAQSTLDDFARRSRRLAEELPPERRPSGEPLTTLVELAARLRERAAGLRPTIEEASGEVGIVKERVDEAAATAEAAGSGADGPRPEDVRDGLAELLASHATGVVVLDEPFAGLDGDLLPQLLDVLLQRSGPGPLVVLTDQPDVLGWAIGLPADTASVTAADSVLNLCRREADTNGTRFENQSDLNSDPARPAHMWAGQR